jgi:aminobenzoyl-glutamate transport protein
MAQPPRPAPEEVPPLDVDRPLKASPPPGDERGWFNRFLVAVEWLGNLLPHPVTLFALFALGVVLISGVAEFFEVSVADPRPEGARGRAPDGRIYAVSLLNAEGLRRIVENLVTNFTSFAPLGTVLVALLGVGVAERSGLIRAAIRGIVLWAADATFINPRILVTTAVVFSGIISNTASELGYVVLVPLGAVVFLSMGRHPLAGLAAAFAGVSGGYSANLFIGTIDPLLAGLTQEAARLIAPEYMVHAAVNWYFMAVSVFLITTMGVIATLKFVEPLLGPYDPSIAMEDLSDEGEMNPLTRARRRGCCGPGSASSCSSACSCSRSSRSGGSCVTRRRATS